MDFKKNIFLLTETNLKSQLLEEPFVLAGLVSFPTVPHAPMSFSSLITQEIGRHMHTFKIFLLIETDLKPQLLEEPFVLASLVSVLKLDLGLLSGPAFESRISEDNLVDKFCPREYPQNTLWA